MCFRTRRFSKTQAQAQDQGEINRYVKTDQDISHYSNPYWLEGVVKAQASLAERTITSTAWNVFASLTKVGVLFVRSVLLARLLPVEVFGIYAFASSTVSLTGSLPAFGMASAFLHRAPETQDEALAAAVHFTLKLVLTSIWALLLAVGAFVFASGLDRVALLTLIIIGGADHLAQTPKMILARRVVHRRLALVQVLDALLTTLVALTLAWRGVTLWALLSIDLAGLVLTFVALYVWRPVWRPRVAWSTPVVRYYLSFGSRTLAADVISKALDRVDDLWAGFFLGRASLSFYSRAYSFATYPRGILAGPINTVARGTYAELKGDRLRMSRAFFRINALLVRSGFLLAGWLALVAPEFIRLLLGAKWLPMLDAFRLMLVFTLLDPIKVTVGNLFVAVGRPELVVRARSLQLVVLISSLFLLGPWLGIAGVALAADMMLVVGMAILLWQARAFVDFSPWRLLGVPSLALIVGISLAASVSAMPVVTGSDWRTGTAKTVIFCFLYGIILLTLERNQLVGMVKRLFR